MLTCTGSVLEVNFPQIDAQVSSMSFVWHFQESGTIHFWSIALGATQYWVLPRELNVNTCSCWIRFHCLRATYIRWPFKLHQISLPQISSVEILPRFQVRTQLIKVEIDVKYLSAHVVIACLYLSHRDGEWLSCALYTCFFNILPRTKRFPHWLHLVIARRLYLSQRDVGWLCPSTGALNIT